MDVDNVREIIGDIHDGYELVKAAKEAGKFIADEYNDMIENMDTDVAKTFIDNVIINDSYM